MLHDHKLAKVEFRKVEVDLANTERMLKFYIEVYSAMPKNILFEKNFLLSTKKLGSHANDASVFLCVCVCAYFP